MRGYEDERVSFESGRQRVVGVLRYSDRGATDKERIVITCHGLMSSKDSGKYVEVARRFRSGGIAVLRFDFRGSGESEGRGNLLTNRILDLKSAIRFVKDRGFGSIGVLGSSYGGSTAILVAGDMPELRALAVWSTPCQLVELFRSIEEPESNVSVAQTQNSRKAVRPSGFMRDLQKYNVAEAVRKVNRILVVHCKEDRVVPWAQAKLIYENAGEPKHMELFEDGDHQILEPSIRKRAIDLSLQWFHRYLDAV